MKQPLVSIIICVRNGERYLSEALQSVTKQTYDNRQIIIVDGQSTDNTANIAKSTAQVRYLWQHNSGIANAYNLGIEAAQGEYVAFLSHDDSWASNKLSTQIHHMLQHPDIQYCITKFKYFIEPGCTPPSGFKRELLYGEHVGRIMETLVAKRTLFSEIGLFDPTLSTGEDLDWYARANDHNVPMCIIPQVLLRKRVHADNLSLNNSTNNQNLLTALRRTITRKQQLEAATA